MKFALIILSLIIGTNVFAQNTSASSNILQSLDCKVSFGPVDGSKIENMQIIILKADFSTTIPGYPKANVTLTLSGQAHKKFLPITNVGYIFAAPPFSQFNVVGYQISWNDNSKSELNLICQENATCTGSGVLLGYPQNMITCKDVGIKR